MNVENKNRMIL